MSNRVLRTRGDTYPETFDILDDGLPIDITGSTVILSIKYNPAINITAVIVDGPTGKIKVPFTADQVATVGVWRYDVQVTYPTSEIVTHIKDEFELEDDVTK